jgi:ketosteroid isomerase-like protein
VAPLDNREQINRFYLALNARRWNEMDELVDPDVTQEWPQSGERIRGIKNFRAILENFPEPPIVETRRIAGAEDKWVLTPTFTPLRVSGTGDVYTVETRINYPNGEVWSGVAIMQFRDGKAFRLTEYFGAPFPPAAWRARWVEKIDPHP